MCDFHLALATRQNLKQTASPARAKNRSCSRPEGGGGRGTLYNSLYGEALPERGAFFTLEVYERVGISRVEVYEKVGNSVI